MSVCSDPHHAMTPDVHFGKDTAFRR